VSLRLYIRPVALVDSPQAMAGSGHGAVRLAGGMAFASHFALILREGGRVLSRRVVTDVAAALADLPAELRDEGAAQWAALRKVHTPLSLPIKGGGTRVIRMDAPQIMGILNITPDSFSDAGSFMDKPGVAHEHAAMMLEAGAAIIDVGGESTRPGAAAVWEGDEVKRILPAVEKLSAMGAAISLDTRRLAVMEAGLAAGAQIVNDVSALRHDPRALDFVARSGAPVCLMHAPGDEHDLHSAGDYADVVLDVFDWLRERRDAAMAAGIPMAHILLDPGIGFGKSLADNLALMNALPLFHALGCPLLVGASRKRMIGALSAEAPAHKRLGGSVALAVKMMEAGVQIIRVHDVPETVQAMHVWRGMKDGALTDFAQIVD
jgi:dihydropteroate synthase